MAIDPATAKAIAKAAVSVATDKETRSKLLYIILIAIACGVAVLLIDHNMKFVMDIADKITVLNYGKVLVSDTPEVVRAHPEVIAAYLGSGIKRTKGVVNDA